MNLESIDAGQEVLEKKEENDTIMSDADPTRKIASDAQTFLAEQTHQVVIPSYALWFDMSMINDIEKRSNPEFFNGRNRSKTPTIYKDYRDFMINTYRLNPIEYLTVTACRRNLAGDVCAVMRVHSFLEQWGLINYQVDAESRPSSIGPPFTGHFRVVADTPRGLQPFTPAPASTLSQGRPHQRSVEALQGRPFSDINLELRRDVYNINGKDATTNAEAEKVPGQHNCFTCGVDCSRVRYHSMNQKNLDLCPSCYQEGRFPSSSQSGDFVRLEAQSNHNESEWTDQEVLLLLEALEMFDENWPDIAAHVGSRTKEQCVLKFLQLPIEEPYLEQDRDKVGPLRYYKAPYDEVENPVMSVVAFLASVVPKEVATAAAKRAVKALPEEQDVVLQTNGNNESLPAKTISADTDNEQAQTSTQWAAETALGTSAAKAKLLGHHEDRVFNQLLATAVTAQLAKVDLKLKQFQELERSLDVERRMIEISRQSCYHERLATKERLQSTVTGLATRSASTRMISNSIDMPDTLLGVSDPLLEL
ncbi:protein of unknown function [Taphrina deformans PYCC 5710]|uniref:Uncharacterized protein n=1 Tax=Taphrina deformans (strain PYCC 5710 / ATCC 11124 / CBS 356.35 / IMI 108563 / JCM 9778 / NBRC 8474) TaxID=1097556 RepID=R4XH21_TAPDE|nr:protein of unknown function [Taphrina deformans PYCC 5710]|eukprot:CCG84988.1 protein of unknown function [Taphrina deformans PYCC 5710]